MKNDNIIIYKDAKFTFFSKDSFKMEFSQKRKFINKNLFIEDLQKKDKIFDISKKLYQNKIVIETEHLLIIYRKGLKIRVTYKPTGIKWKYGKHDRRNLKGSSLDLFKYPKFRGKRLTDGVLSRSGYFVYEDFSQTYWADKKKWIYISKIKGYKNIFYIGYGKNYKKGLQEYSNIFGKVPMLPQWVFGFWYSRYYAYSDKEYLKLVKKYRGYGLPIDVMVIDTDWRKEVWRGYDWAKKYFPVPDRFIKEMKKRKIKLTLNDHPGYNFSEKLSSQDSHFKYIKRKLNLKTDEWHPNWRNKKDVELFVNILLKEKLKQGIDFWWVDGWGADGILSISDAKIHKIDGMEKDIEKYKGFNPQLWLNYFYYKISEKVYNRRGIILSRWGGIGSHRYPLWFSGDTFSNFKTLKYQVYFTCTAGNVLTNYWSHDIGGFLGRKISKELYIRWIQFGMFSPVFRTHSDHGIREPWNFDTETLKIFKKYLLLRYKLFPYFYRLAYESYKNALPIIRAMYHNFPEDKNSYKYKYQYMIGDSILVAPITKKMGNKKFIKKKIYFPEGEWIGIENLFVTQGKNVHSVNVPLTEIPFFVKYNSVIPIIPVEVASIDDWDKQTLQFEIFGDKKVEYNYYEDDGISNNYKKGEYFLLHIAGELKSDSYFINMKVQNKRYKGMKRKKKIIFILHLLEERKIKHFFVNNEKVNIKKTTKVFNMFNSLFNSYRVEIVKNL